MATPEAVWPHDTDAVAFRDAVRVWAKIGMESFGGPAGQIAVMHRELVERRAWIDEHRFLHALNYCMLLPGPEAQQLSVYIGWLLHGARGAMVAGLLFVLPGLLTMLALSTAYVLWSELPLVDAAFRGVKAVVVALVVLAVVRLARRAVRHPLLAGVAAGAFVSMAALGVAFPLVLAGAALAGVLIGRARPDAVRDAGHGRAGREEPSAAARPSARRSVRVLAAGLTIWLAPVALLALVRGGVDVFTRLGAFFAIAATVTFGGAYAVLAYVAQAAVETYGWLSAEAMLDGLGLAESTPGPLILVVQHVGFLAAHGEPGGLPPLVAGVLGALLVAWVTFAPCFLWIFLGAPYVEWLRGRRALSAALAGITAAVVGVIANLGLWFGVHVLFGTVGLWRAGPIQVLRPVWGTLDAVNVAIAALALVLLGRLRAPLLPVLGLGALLGLAADLPGIV